MHQERKGFYGWSVTFILCVLIWYLLYQAQHLEYDLNYAFLFYSFTISFVLTLLSISLFFMKKGWVIPFKWQILFFQLIAGPIPVIITILNYQEIFGTWLKS